MKTGWYFNIGQHEFFIETAQKNKTRKFIEKILEAINQPVTDNNVKYISYYLIKANLEIKTIEHDTEFYKAGTQYYNIFGKNFSGYGSFVNDGKTTILII